MLIILKLASHYADFEQLDFGRFFGVKHIQEVLKIVTIHSAFERSVIYHVFEYRADTPIQNADDFLSLYVNNPEDFDQTNRTCDDEVLEKLSLIKAYDIDLFKDEIYSLYNETFPLDYETKNYTLEELFKVTDTKF